VTSRCNVDFQFLMCAPDVSADAAEVHQQGDGAQPAQDEPPAPAPSQPARRRRLTKKTATSLPKHPSGGKSGSTVAAPGGQKMLRSRKASKRLFRRLAQWTSTSRSTRAR
jgi:hypothetical protein